MKMLALCLTLLGLAGPARADDAVRRALTDELARSMKELGAGKPPRPHHLVYLIIDVEQAVTTAKFGGTIHTKVNRFRAVRAGVRVGDRSADNGNFDTWDNRASFEELPLDDDYQALRARLAEVTRREYEEAVAAFEKKRAVTKDLPRRPDEAAKLDFDDAGSADELVHAGPGARAPIDPPAFARTARALSAVFRDHPIVIEGTVRGQHTIIRRRLLTSDGAFRDERRSSVRLLAHADGRAEPDGFTIVSQRAFEATSLAGLPSLDRMKRSVAEMAEDLLAQEKGAAAEAGKAVVLFEGPAAGALWTCLLAGSLSGTPLPRVEPRQRSQWSNTFFNKMGKPVAPPFLQAFDDPRTEVGPGGTPLFGAYQADEEGVLAQRVSLIEDGVLTGMLMSRIPRREIARSNGHARGNWSAGGLRGAVGVLTVTAGKAALTEGALRDRAEAEARAAGAALYIVRDVSGRYSAIREIEAPAGFATGLAMNGGGWSVLYVGGGGCSGLEPLAVSRLRDGREERVRGLRLKNTPDAAQLGDVVALGKDLSVYNFTKTDGRLSDPQLEATVISPPTLMKNVAVERISWRAARPSYPHPHFKSGLVGKKIKD